MFGAGEYGRRFIERLGDETEIVYVVDNFHVGECCMGYKIISAQELAKKEFDSCVICLNDYTNLEAYDAVDSIIRELIFFGIPDHKIQHQNVYYEKDDCRIIFLKEYSRSVERIGVGGGSIAECGVMRGHFAHYISKYFRGRKFYLFDTFSGLDERDILKEPERAEWLRTRGNLYLQHGNEAIALRRCIDPERVIIKKGYVPETFRDIEDERFVFVNLDMDVYAPTLSALRFFSTRMVKQGVILCHDYFNPMYPGIKEVIDEFEEEQKFLRIPLKDSLCIIPVI